VKNTNLGELMKISACLIVKNEESNLKKLIPQLKQFADEIVIVDTGSTDKTKEVAKDCKVYDFKWIDDFSAARNFSYEKATGDWIIWIDGDDKILNPKAVRKVVEDAEKNNIDWVFIEYLYSFDEWGNCIARHWKQRITKANTGHWVKTVHEDFVSDQEVRMGKDHQVKIVHQHKAKDAKVSAKRNLDILMEEYKKDGDKTDPRTLLYLGDTYMAQRKFSEAIPFFLNHAKQSGHYEHRYFSMIKASKCLNFLKRYDEAINLALEATKIVPDWQDAYYQLAEIYFNMEDYPKVINWIEVGLKKEHANTVAVLNDLDYTLFPLGRYAISLLQAQRFDEAKKVSDYLEYKLKINHPEIDKLKIMVNDAVETENYVKGVINASMTIYRKKRPFLSKFMETIPEPLDEDIRIQQFKHTFTQPKTWSDKSIVIFCGNSLEDWSDPSVIKGIGGSEEAVIYMGRELTKLGYEVTVFNRCGDLRGEYYGVKYIPWYFFNPNDQYNILISWRNPNLFGSQEIKAKKKYLWMHDKFDDRSFNQKIIDQLDKVIVLSQYQRDQIPVVPETKIFCSRNGVNMQSIIEADSEKRDKYRMIYSSSYDRGLEHLLHVWPKVIKAVPKANLHIFYGWNNFDKVYANDPNKMAWKKYMVDLMKQKGIKEYGRISHRQLAKEFAKSEVFAYPSHFWEISCISAMWAQASGAFPITSNYAALDETVMYGKKIPGVITLEKVEDDFDDKYAQVLIGWLKKNGSTKSSERISMKNWARKRFGWDGVAKSWDKEFK